MKDAQKHSASCKMLPEESHSFAKGVENLIDPINVGTIHFVQQLNSLLPKFIQKKLMKASSQKTPSMGFVVEPYSSFLCYEILDTDKATELIPNEFELIKTSIFDDDEPKYYCILGTFKAHTSAFWGGRTEFYVIAKDKRTNLLTWVIVDYDTNTISYDKKRGLISPNSKSTITINHRGELFVDINNLQNNRKLEYVFNVENGSMKSLDQRLWLEGNLSVGYGRDLGDSRASVFSLKFEPCEVEKALEIDTNKINIIKNDWYKDILADKPSKVACFPYAQHFISDSPGYSSNLKSEKELITAINKIDFSKIKVFETKSLKKMFIINSLISALITTTLLVLYLTK
jgi:hypothetical protein